MKHRPVNHIGQRHPVRDRPGRARDVNHVLVTDALSVLLGADEQARVEILFMLPLP